MKEGWNYKKLGEVATFARGLTYSKNDEVEQSSNIVLRSNNIDLIAGKLDFSELKYLKEDFVIPDEKRLRKGSLFICMSNGSKAHLGKVAYVDKDYGYAFGGFMGQISPNNEINGLYLHYALSSPFYKEYIKSLSEGANINNLKFKDLSEFTIKYPSLSEQQSIVDYLDSAFAKINAMKANAEKGLNEAKALFQASLKEMLEPKEGWEQKKLKEVAYYRRGSFPQPYGNKEWYDGDGAMPFVQVAELQEDSFEMIQETKRRISKIAQPLSVFVPAGTVLVSLQGSIGKVAITDYDCYVDRTIAIFQDYKINIDKTFFAYQLKIRFEIERIKARGTTIKTITKEEFANFIINCPSLSEQQTIVATLDSLKSKVDRLQENYDKISQECDALKQAILRQVFE